MRNVKHEIVLVNNKQYAQFDINQLQNPMETIQKYINNLNGNALIQVMP